MFEAHRLYVERRTPVQTVRDRAEAGVGIAALGGAAYLFFEERPHDLEKIHNIDQRYLQGKCSASECGPKATDKMMHGEYRLMDLGGSILLTAVATIALADRVIRPIRRRPVT